MGNLKLNCFVTGMSEFVHYTLLDTHFKKTNFYQTYDTTTTSTTTEMRF